MEVRPGIHRIDTDVAGRIACVFLLQGTNSAILVDTGMNYAPADSIFPYLEGIGCSPEVIERVIITHCDFDHMGGGDALRRALPNAQFLCHPAERIESQDVEMLIAHRLGEFGRDHGIEDSEETKKWVRDNVTPTYIDGVLSGGEKIDLGGLIVEVDVLPGHTAGHLALYVHDQDVAIVADAVLGSSLLYRDGTPAFPPTYRYPGQYGESINKLEKLAPDLMLTSHFDPLQGSQVQDFLDETRDFMDRLERAVLERVTAGASVTLRELSEQLAPEFGSWDEAAGLLICWPILGHLECMVARGDLVCRSEEAIRRYQKPGALR